MERFLSDVIEIEGEEGLIQNLHRYFKILSDRECHSLFLTALFQGKQDLAIKVLLALPDRRTPLFDNPQKALSIKGEHLQGLFERYGEEALFQFLTKLTKNNIQVKWGYEVFNFPSVLDYENSELTELTKKLITHKVELCTYIKEQDRYQPQPIIEETLSDPEWFSSMTFPPSFYEVRNLRQALKQGNISASQDALRCLFTKPAIIQSHFLDILNIYVNSPLQLDSRDFFDDAVRDMKIHQASTLVFIGVITYLINNQTLDARNFFQSYVQKYKQFITQKQIDSDGSINIRRYDIFGSWGALFDSIDQCVETDGFLLALFRALKMCAIPTQFMPSVALTYVLQNHTQAVSTKLLQDYETYCGTLSSIDIQLALINVSRLSTPNHWREIAGGFSKLLDTGQLSSGVELAVRFQDRRLFEDVCTFTSDTKQINKLEEMWNFENLLRKRDPKETMRFLKSLLSEDRLKSLDIANFFINLPTINYREAWGLLQDIGSTGFIIDNRVYLVLCKRYMFNEQYSELLSFIQFLTDELGVSFSELLIYKLVALHRVDKNVEFKSLYKTLLGTGSTDAMQDFITNVNKYIKVGETNEVLNSLLFTFTEAPQGEVKVLSRRSQSFVVRDRSLVTTLKEIYGDRCQVCEVIVRTPFGNMSEAAHIQGLGNPHYGPDVLGNMLVLCPNHHTSFDNAGWYLRDNFEIINIVDKQMIGNLLVEPAHKILSSCITYQRNYALKAGSMGKRAWKAVSRASKD